MGTNVPDKKEQQIIWFENHWPLWQTTPEKYGLTAAQVTAIKNATNAARTAFTTAKAARQTAKNATTSQDEAVGSMNRVGRDGVNIIKAFIENSGDTSLWGAAGIEPPSPRGRAANPNAPTDLKAQIDSEGNLTVSWKASQPRGVDKVVYLVRRSIDGGEFALLDTVGEKSFTDETVSSGTRTVAYTVQAKRGNQRSPLSSSLTVRFGRGGAGASGIIASITTGPTPTKLAA